MRIAGRSALGAAVALMCAATPALADKRYDSDVKVSESFPAFHGKVSSSNDICVENRKVILYGEVPGPDDVLGKTRTNDRGRWKIKVEPVSGAFYAKARPGGPWRRTPRPAGAGARRLGSSAARRSPIP